MVSEAYQSIKKLCDDTSFTNPNPESYFVEQLRSILEKNPGVANERDILFGMTLLHHAVEWSYRSVDFCKILVEQNAELVKTPDHFGSLPLHRACSACCGYGQKNIEIIEFLFQNRTT